jgi:hypothetical protein
MPEQHEMRDDESIMTTSKTVPTELTVVSSAGCTTQQDHVISRPHALSPAVERYAKHAPLLVQSSRDPFPARQLGPIYLTQ